MSDWDEDDLYQLAALLEQEAPDLIGDVIDGYISELEYYEHGDRYSATYKWLRNDQNGQQPGWITMNFRIDFGGGRPFPRGIEQYAVRGHGVKFVCGFTDREEFIDG